MSRIVYGQVTPIATTHVDFGMVYAGEASLKRQDGKPGFYQVAYLGKLPSVGKTVEINGEACEVTVAKRSELNDGIALVTARIL
jgi:hypothetical protein